MALRDEPSGLTTRELARRLGVPHDVRRNHLVYGIARSLVADGTCATTKQNGRIVFRIRAAEADIAEPDRGDR